jgi:hypothetical protein
VLADLVHEERHRVGHAGQVGIEPELRLAGRCLDIRLRVERVESVGGGDARGDLDAAGLELVAQLRKLVVVEIELDGLRLERDRVEDAIALGILDEASELFRVKNGFDLPLLLS